MVKIEQDIKRVLEASRIPITFIGMRAPLLTDKFPVMQFFNFNSVYSGGHGLNAGSKKISAEITLRIYSNFPAGCTSFDDAVAQTKEDLTAFEDIIHGMTELLSERSSVYNHYYCIGGNAKIEFQRAPISVTENHLIVTQARFLLEYSNKTTGRQLFDESNLGFFHA